jgi:ribosome biogenesis protein BMS1
MDDKQVNKKFKPQRAGRKKEKKEIIDKKKRNISTDKKNHKAFQVKPSGNLQRTLDLKEKNYHLNNIKNRTYYEPPPMVVGIVGPPKVNF